LVRIVSEKSRHTPFSLTSSLKTSPCYDTDSGGTPESTDENRRDIFAHITEPRLPAGLISVASYLTIPQFSRNFSNFDILLRRTGNNFIDLYFRNSSTGNRYHASTGTRYAASKSISFAL
jgi:hypothetical protein